MLDSKLKYLRLEIDPYVINITQIKVQSSPSTATMIKRIAAAIASINRVNDIVRDSETRKDAYVILALSWSSVSLFSSRALTYPFRI